MLDIANHQKKEKQKNKITSHLLKWLRSKKKKKTEITNVGKDVEIREP